MILANTNLSALSVAQLHTFIQSIYPLGEKEWNAFSEIWTPFECKRKTMLTAIGETEKHLYFVLEDFPFDNKGHNIQKNLENRFKSIKHQYRFVAGREDTIPLASATYKRVICRRTIHEFTNRQKMASELVRILADGGILTVIEGIPEQPGFVDPYCNKPYLTKEEIINSFPSLTVLTDTVIVYPKWKLSMINFTKKKQIIN